MLEKEIENLILQYLHFLPGADAWKIDTVGVFDIKRERFRVKKTPWNTKGVPDILLFYKSKTYFLEVKTPKRIKNLSEHQKKFFQCAIENNQECHVVTSVKDVENILFLNSNVA